MDRRSDADIFLFDEDAKDFDRSGAASPSADQDATTVAGPSDVKSMDLFRRAMPQMVAEEDVCSICLDAFTDEDPGNATVCGSDTALDLAHAAMTFSACSVYTLYSESVELMVYFSPLCKQRKKLRARLMMVILPLQARLPLTVHYAVGPAESRVPSVLP